jgi:hypothetical protein
MHATDTEQHKRLYRGLETPFNANHDITITDAPNGYSTWTDNPALATKYAGETGHVYYIDLPIDKEGTELIDEHGERPLYINNQKPAGLDGITGDEYLIYVDHEDYASDLIIELKSTNKKSNTPSRPTRRTR